MDTLKTFKTLSLGLLIGSTLFLSNCKKDEKDPEPTPVVTPAPTNTEKLTGKNFKLTALTVDPALLGVTDFYSQYDDCQKDDLYRFDTPNIYKEDEGATKCNTNDAQTKTGTWAWNTDETIITTSLGGETISYTVLSNDGTTLKVKHTEQLGGINYVVTGIFVKQ